MKKNNLLQEAYKALSNVNRIGSTGVVSPQLLEQLGSAIITRAAAYIVQAALEGITYTVDNIIAVITQFIGNAYTNLLIGNGSFHNIISQGIKLGNSIVINESKGVNMNQYGMNVTMGTPMMNNQVIMVDQFGRPIMPMANQNMIQQPMVQGYGAVIPQQNVGISNMPNIVNAVPQQQGMTATANAYQNTGSTNRFSNSTTEQTQYVQQVQQTPTQQVQQLKQEPVKPVEPVVKKDLNWICTEGISVENGEAVGSATSKRNLRLIHTSVNDTIENILDQLLIFNKDPFNFVKEGTGYRVKVKRKQECISRILNIDGAAEDYTAKINLIASDVIKETKITSGIEDTDKLIEYIETKVRSIYKREHAVGYIKEIKDDLDKFMENNVKIYQSELTKMSKWVSEYEEEALILLNSDLLRTILRTYQDSIDLKSPLLLSNHTYPEVFEFLENAFGNIDSPFLSIYLVATDGCYKAILYRPSERLGKYGELVYKMELISSVGKISLV